MSKHNSRHGSNRSPAEIMMHGGHHYAGGGSAGAAVRAMPSNIPNFKEGGMAEYRKGGRPKSFMKNGRYCHAEGDTVSATNPITGHKYGEGPTSYSESVTDTKLRRGGRARRHRHAEGDTVEVSKSPQEILGNYRKGGRARRCHAEGDSVEGVPFKRGGRTHRSHHDFGDTVHKVGRGIGNAVKTVGRGLGKAAMNIAPFLPLLLKEGGSSHKRGGHARRRHHAEGEEAKMAMGGVGKVRKGMMTRSGRMISNI